jgi:hypothetical protein
MNRERRAHPGPPPHNATPTRQAKHDTTTRVAAAFYGPSGARTLAVLVVERCPWCSGVHFHRGNGGVRRSGCGRGVYLVVPRPVLDQRGAA